VSIHYDDRREGISGVFDVASVFVQRRLFELAGGAVMLCAVAMVLALVSYQPLDPSWNNATPEPPRNFLGLPGAIFADLVVQTVGLAAWIFISPIAVWGWWLTAKRLPPRFIRKLTGWVVGTAFIAAFLALMPIEAWRPFDQGLGGVIGTWLGGKLSALVLLSGEPSLAAWLAPVLALAAGLAGWIAALGLSRRNFGLAPKDAPQEREPGRRLPRLGLPSFALPRLRLPSFRLPSLSGLSARRKDKPSRVRRPRFSTMGERVGGERGLDDGDTADTDDFEDDADDADGEDDADIIEPLVPRTAKESDKKKPRVQRSKSAKAKPSKREQRDREPTLELEPSAYKLPPLTLLQKPDPKAGGVEIDDEALEQNARLLESVLGDFGVKGEIIGVRPGPVVTLYELEPAPGIKSSRVIGLADDIARSMAAVSARVAVIPGRNAIGIELPNERRATVYLRELLASDTFEKSSAKLALALGKDIGGAPAIADLTTMPHLLVAGTTGSGKSVSINTMILSLLYRLPPDQCKLIMIDPKMLELSVYEGIPHLLSPVVTEPKKAVVALKWVVREMEDRYRKMSKLGVRNIRGFNDKVKKAMERGQVLSRKVQTGFDKETGEAIYEEENLAAETMPYIVVIIDEMADLMIVAGKDIEAAVQRLAQMARAAGIHLIMATQRPSVDVITGTIKANFPTRISFQVTSKIDSRTILGEMGAEQLLGMGDMLYMAGGGRIKRVHGPFVSDEEVEDVVAALKKQGKPHYLDAITEEPEEENSDVMGALFGGGDSGDDLYDQAVAIVARDRKVSTSYIQRKLQIGYNRAARIIERMEEDGVISGPNGQGKREVLLPDHGEFE